MASWLFCPKGTEHAKVLLVDIPHVLVFTVRPQQDKLQLFHLPLQEDAGTLING